MLPWKRFNATGRRLRWFIPFVALLVVVMRTHAAPVSQEWAAIYNGTANGADVAAAMAVDASGNVYVTGSSVGVEGKDYLTIKYGPNGNRLWVARYDGPGADEAKDVGVDADGNVYVTGFTGNPLCFFPPCPPNPIQTSRNWATIKYAPDGNELWVVRDVLGAAAALAIDQSGDVSITGYRDVITRHVPLETEPHTFTIKYDRDGNTVWSALRVPVGDGGKAIAVDPNGNVYVAGSNENQSGCLHCAPSFASVTAKYDLGGNQVWEAKSAAQCCVPEQIHSIGLDSHRNVYDAGALPGVNGSGYHTTKLDSLGGLLWEAHYHGPGVGDDSANALAVDPDGNAYVTGSSAGSGDCGDVSSPRNCTDYATVKYDPNGHELWVARYDGPGHVDDAARAIAVDAQHRVYVTGFSGAPNPVVAEGGFRSDYATVSYDANGLERWVARYDGPGTESDDHSDQANDIALDSTGHVAVTGFVGGFTGTADYATVKYAQADVGTLAGTSTPGPIVVNLTTLGTSDWRQWGLLDASSVNHKAVVTPKISALTLLGAGPGRFGNDPLWNKLSWSDGTPTVSQSKFSGGIYVQGKDNGYQLTVPANTNQQTLKLYVGGWMSTSRITATLSDGAEPYMTVFGNASGVYSQVVTLIFTANSSGQTLTVRHTQDGKNGNIGLQAVALSQQTHDNVAPTIDAIGNKTVNAGSALAFNVTASDPDGPFPLAMTISNSVPALPAAVNYVDNGLGSGAFDWTPSGADVGSYQVTFAAADGAGHIAHQTITITVTDTGGTLNGAVAAGPVAANLTSVGQIDWEQWGLVNASSVNRKAGVTQQISGLTSLGAAPGRFGNDPMWNSLSWSDGTPTATKTNFSGGIYFTGANNGYRLTVPADTTQRTLKLYVGGWQSNSRIEATLSDGSAAPFVVTFGDPADVYSRVVTLTFAAASSGQTLTIRHTQSGKGGNIGVQAAALAQ